MFPTISIIKDPKQGISSATLFEKTEQISLAGLSENENEFLSKKLEKGTECSFLKYPELRFFGKIKITLHNILTVRRLNKISL